MFEYSVDNFKALFNKGEFPFLPVYDEHKMYMELDETYYFNTERFYTSKVDYNKGNLPTNEEKWAETADRVESFVLDEDIARAFNEALVNFNPALFDEKDLELVFYYLTAHYLTVDKNNASSGGAVSVGIMTSKTVGNVSAGYTIPNRFMKNPVLAYYATTGFGQKYLSYLIPRMTARCAVVRGRSLP